ncbi:hypothetical protein D3C80_768690 [compost metagenome]
MAAVQRQGQDQQVRIDAGREQAARRHQGQDRQTGQQQIKRKDPARPLHLGRVAALDKGDVELTRQAEDGQARHQDDGPETAIQIGPARQIAEAGGHIRRSRGVTQQHQGEDRHGQQGRQLDDGLDADGLDQAPVVLSQVGTARPEQDGEPGQNPGHDQNRQALGPGDGRARGQHLPRHRQGFQLKRDIGQRPQDGHQRHRRAQGRALAVARGDEVGHRADVLAPGRRRDPLPQREQHRHPQGRAHIDGQVFPGRTRRRPHRPVIGPRGAIDGQGQGVERRPQRPAARLDRRPLVPPGHREQDGHVGGHQGQGREAEHDRHLGRSGGLGQG